MGLEAIASGFSGLSHISFSGSIHLLFFFVTFVQN